jgi:hypothetical protein
MPTPSTPDLPLDVALLRLAAALRAGDLGRARDAQAELRRVSLAGLDAEAQATLYTWRCRPLPGGPLRGLQARVADEAEAEAWPRLTGHQRVLLAAERAAAGLDPEPRGLAAERLEN